MKIFLYIIISVVALWFIGGMVTAWTVGLKKNRGKFALSTFLSFSDDAKSMLLEIFNLYKADNVNEINDIVEKSTNTTDEIIYRLSPQNRSDNFSSGKVGDKTTYIAYESNFKEKGYSQKSSLVLAGILFFELDRILGNSK